MGKPFALKDVYFLKDLPKTRNAKIMRRVIKNICLGKELGDVSSLLNPECIEEIKRILKVS